MADDLWVGAASKTDQAHLHLSANYEAVPTNCIQNIWNTAYKGVKRCESAHPVIKKTEEIKPAIIYVFFLISL